MAPAIPGAVAVEMVHYYSLLLDDVMDGDRERRNRPAAWAVFGESPALCAADALLLAAVQLVSEVPGNAGRSALGVLLGATQEMVTGQSVDVCLAAGEPPALEGYVELAEAKTGAPLGGSAAIDAVLAGARPEVVTGLCCFGLALGVLFQVVDDILDVWGRPEATRPPGRERPPGEEGVTARPLRPSGRSRASRRRRRP